MTHTAPVATGYPAGRRIAVLLAALFGIGMSFLQTSTGYGQSQREFSADSDALLRVATWAFAIWGLIYLGLLIHAVWQAWPKTRETPFLRKIGWPSVVAMVGIGLWIPAASYDMEVATIVIIVGSAIAAIAPLASTNACRLERRDYWMAATPLGLLAGWLTIASAANIIIVATGNNWLPTGMDPNIWPMVAVAVVALIAAIVTIRSRLLAYPLPIVWGLAGVFAAEQARHPTLAFVALGVAIGLAGLSLVTCFGVRKGHG